MYDAADDPAIVRPLDTPYSVGKCGSIRSHCSSLSQNKFLRTARIPKKTNHATWNQDCLGLAAELMSSDPSHWRMAWARGGSPHGVTQKFARAMDALGMIARCTGFCTPMPAGSLPPEWTC